MKMQALRRAASALVLGSSLLGASARATVEIGGVPVDEVATVGGTPLVLDGAGYRKRGYFKIDVTALYTQTRVSSSEALEKVAGPRRLEIVVQQDITGSQASRYFLIDFEASATPAEFAQLITEVSMIGDVYSSLPRIRKGDVVTLDWVPGKGLVAMLDGNVLTPHGAPSPYINSELLGRVMFRMYTSGKTPAELHDNLFGVSYSMRDHPPAPGTAPAAAATAASSPATRPAPASH